MNRFFISIILLSLLMGCNNNQKFGIETSVEDGLVLNSIVYSLGGEPERTEVSYSVQIWNRTKKTVIIKTIEPIMDESITSKLINSNLNNEVQIELKSGAAERISGSFVLDTKGLDKEKISKLDYNSKSFKVTTEQEVSMFLPQI
jgi:hypothetical protein